MILLIMQALCIVLEIEPVMKQSKKDGIVVYHQSYWDAALTPKLLNNPNLTQQLIDFDRTKVTAEVIKKLEIDVISNSDYNFENAYHASKAAPAFYEWVRSVREYFYIFKEV